MASRSHIPRVSVILPVFNRAALVGRAIESVLAQEFGDLELIVVDDGSGDETCRVVEGYAGDTRLRLIRSGSNQGANAARNLGVGQARGEIVAFQDSDDYWLPGKLAAQVERLKHEPGCGACYCGAFWYGDRLASYIPGKRAGKIDGDLAVSVLRVSPVWTPTLVLRRETLAQAGGFDPEFRRFQDWDLMIRVAQTTRISLVEDPMVILHRTPGNITSSAFNGALARDRMVVKYAKLYAEHPALLARQYHEAGRLWLKAGNRHEARARFRAALAIRPAPGYLASYLNSLVPWGNVRA